MHHDHNLYNLTVRAGPRTSVIHTTASHLFRDATTRRWVKAADFRPGDHLRTPDGTTATVADGYTPSQASGWMWDLTIPGDHDFYIDTATGAVLVHNHDSTYIPPPRGNLPGFPDFNRVPWRGGARWVNPKTGEILTWDSLHGKAELFNKRGQHLREFDPNTGEQTKPAVPGRECEK